MLKENKNVVRGHSKTRLENVRTQFTRHTRSYDLLPIPAQVIDHQELPDPLFLDKLHAAADTGSSKNLLFSTKKTAHVRRPTGAPETSIQPSNSLAVLGSTKQENGKRVSYEEKLNSSSIPFPTPMSPDSIHGDVGHRPRNHHHRHHHHQVEGSNSKAESSKVSGVRLLPDGNHTVFETTAKHADETLASFGRPSLEEFGPVVPPAPDRKMVLGWLWAFAIWLLGHPLVVLVVKLCARIILALAAGVRKCTMVLVWARRWTRLTPRERELVNCMSNTNEYREWRRCAKELDRIQGHEKWKSIAESPLYNHGLIKARLELLRGLAALDGEDHAFRLIQSLRSGLLRDLGGICNLELYSYCHTGTKHLIEDYIDEVCLQLRRIAARPSLSVEEKFSFFYETRQSYGSSALLLSGGASLGLYHLGVIRALHERRLLPRVISGASAGALVAALVCVLRDEELPLLFEHPDCLRLDAFGRRGREGEIKRKLWRLLTEGVLMDIRLLEEVCRENVGNMTFREAYLRTGRVVNITVSGSGNFEMSRILNYLTAPSVLLWSAACASCALPFLFRPVQLMCKDHLGRVSVYEPSKVMWKDGTLECDLPMRRLSELFNINHFIVSQVGPHVAPFVSSKHRSRAPDAPPAGGIVSGWFRSGLSLMGTLVRSEFRHRLAQIATVVGSPTLSSLVGQSYLGHVNIVAELSIRDYLSLVRNPTKNSLARSIRIAQRWTWPKLSILENHLKVEQVLEECFEILRVEMEQRHSKLGGARSASAAAAAATAEAMTAHSPVISTQSGSSHTINEYGGEPSSPPLVSQLHSSSCGSLHAQEGVLSAVLQHQQLKSQERKDSHCAEERTVDAVHTSHSQPEMGTSSTILPGVENQVEGFKQEQAEMGRNKQNDEEEDHSALEEKNALHHQRTPSIQEASLGQSFYDYDEPSFLDSDSDA